MNQDLVARTLINNNPAWQASHGLIPSPYKALSSANFTASEITPSKMFREVEKPKS